jgi:protein ImuA
MRLISCHDGRLLTLNAEASGDLAPSVARGQSFTTGLPALDALPPGEAFARGVVHEILAESGHGTPLFLAMLLAQRSARDATLIWCDAKGTIYPPALAAHGIPLERLFLLHPRSTADQTWAVAECLRCKEVAAVIASIDYRLSRVEARRLQLSAERGGGVGILLRPADRSLSAEHAAATRWLVRPVPGERTVQRWSLQLIHGHGGRVGQAVILEHSRETNRVRAVEQLADRPGEKKAADTRSHQGMRYTA